MEAPALLADVGLLAEAAHAVHGGRDLAAKVSWVAEAARSLTGASFAAYVATPEEGVLVAAYGEPSLATAGTGDVLTGVIGAFLAKGMSARLASARKSSGCGK